MSSISASVPFCIARIALVLAKGAVDHPHVGDHASVLVELGVEDQRPGRRLGLPLGGGDALDDRLEDLRHAHPGLGGDPQRFVGVATGQVGDFGRHALRLGAGQVDLVDHRDQLEAGVDRQVGVGDGLRLDPLGGVDDQQRALAGGEAARDLVGEVDVARRVDQVQVKDLAVGGLVLDSDRLRLDRDPALALEVHRVEHLRLHFRRVDRPGDLEDPVGQGRLAVVDVGDDREVADVVHGRVGSMAIGARVLSLRMRGPAGGPNWVRLGPLTAAPPARESRTRPAPGRQQPQLAEYSAPAILSLDWEFRRWAG